MQSILNIFLGILSGVLTTILLWWCNKLFIPWFENRLYRGMLLDGKWSGKRQSTIQNSGGENVKVETLEFLIDLKQNGYLLNGIFKAKSINHQINDDYENLYHIRGHISDNYAVLEYYPVSRKRVGLGSIVLKIRDGGKQMEGSVSFVNEGDMNIMSLDRVVLKREIE